MRISNFIMFLPSLCLIVYMLYDIRKRIIKKYIEYRYPNTIAWQEYLKRSVKYPFLYHIPCSEQFRSQNPYAKKFDRDVWFVKFGPFDYKYYSSSWMADDTLGNQVLIPDIDVAVETHTFYSEKEALEFIKNWWKKQ